MADTRGLTLIAQLGSGGMADVYLALRHGVGGFTKLVVVKRLRPSVEHDLRTMFRDETRLAARLNHPNVVQTFQADNDELEMEFLDGQSLHRILKRLKAAGRKLDLDLSLAIVEGLLSALHYAHELTEFDGTPLNVIHRDVSPQNLFVTYDGKVKLIDFGIAKAADQEEVTQIGIVKGKVRFMAPEQARGGLLDRRVDVFAAGIVLWELLTGERYWGKTRELDIVRRLKNGELPPPADEVNPDVPCEVADICQRALALDPKQRYASCAEFLSDLATARPTPLGVDRRLGTVVGELFVDDRKMLHKVVEEETARRARDSVGSLAKIASSRSGVHSRSDFTALPTSHTAPPVQRSASSERPVRFGWLGLGAACLAVAATLIGMRLPVHSGPSVAAGAAVQVTSAHGKARSASTRDAGASLAYPEEADSEDDTLLESGEPVYK